MTKKDRVQIGENAINEYLEAKRSGNTDAIKTAVNRMENVYIMMCDNIDSKLLQKAHPDIYAECSKRTTYKRFSVV